jgi:thiamine transporter ThiT
MSGQTVYQAVILILLIIGFVLGATFISQHRPRQWKRLEAWDASGFVLIATAIYLRNIILAVTRWPGSAPHGWGDMVFGIGSLLIIDGLFLLRVISYRSFAQRNAQRVADGRTDAIT